MNDIDATIDDVDSIYKNRFEENFKIVSDIQRLDKFRLIISLYTIE
jgi:hypothetical protein